MPKEVNLTGEEVVALTKEYLTEEDVHFVHKALVYAVECHSGQYRKSGEPYIIHPIQVAGILAKLKLDAVTVACGFLHDVVEDTDATLDDLEREFGPDVRVIVDGVTKLGKVEYKSIEEQLAENHRKMLMAMSEDIRVILVKLSDRLHNMRTLKHLRKDKQERISKETMEMHEVAEYGVAAHWAYKKGIKGQVNSKESAIGMNWIKEMMELQDQADDAKEFVDSVKENYLAEEIYVFTPDGAVRSLPKDSGPIDFAYEIHTKVGEKATGAKVNGRMVPLTTKLKTGDQVEIIANPNSFGPSRDWLNMVKTSKARNKIRQFFKNQDKELSVNKGREMLMAQFQENGYVANKFMDKRHMDQVLQKTSYKTEDSLFAAIGFGEIGAITVFNRLTEKERREEERAKAKAEAEELVKGGEVKVENKETLKVKHEGGVVIEGASGLLVRIAKCCNPVPGDDIVGYITKGRGVAIHRVDCMNLRAQENYEQRLLDVEWEDQYSSSNKEYLAHIDIYGLNRTGLLNDVLQVLSNTTKNISTVNAQPTKDMKFANIHVSFGIANLSTLTTVVDKIKSVPEVYSVKRTNG
ncbi:GTP pyrophosphokinase, stringent response protein [Streptococcus pneumoniae]|nr:GTP pyrophosphokinase, stringent response protein [Streptococcus pneumoniae]